MLNIASLEAGGRSAHYIHLDKRLATLVFLRTKIVSAFKDLFFSIFP